MQYLRGQRAVSAVGAVLLAACCLVGGKSAQAQTLYDGDAGGVPASQGWLLLGTFPGGAIETFNPAGFTTLSTSADEGIYSGYTNYNVALSGPPSFFTPTTTVNPAFPILDRNTGFRINFTMQLVAETHSRLERAGFSILVISNDLQGVEIGFHPTDLFAQSPTATVAENNSAAGIAALTAAMTSYSLVIQGTDFTLSANNAPLLQGTLKNYTGQTGFGTDVYRTPNFLFLGDDTTSASATTNLKFVGITAVAPEPSAALLALTGLIGLGTGWAARRRTR